MKDIYVSDVVSLPLSQLFIDPNQPRKDLGIEGEDNRLLLSIKTVGLGYPLAVRKVNNKYEIVDGARRFTCAKMLGWKDINCFIFTVRDEGELKRLRFELQNNRRPWKPLERSQEVKSIKALKRFNTNKELAEYLHISANQLGQSLELQEKRELYQTLMNEYSLSESYQVEFVRLEPKIRPIKEFSREQIIQNLFERVRYKVIRSAKDFRKLGSIFLRTDANKEELCRYLKDQDMKVEELTERTTRSGLVRDIETLMKQVSTKLSKGVNISHEEKTALLQLRELLNKGL